MRSFTEISDNKMKILVTFLSVLCFTIAQDYNCTTAGRFRYRDPTCRSYYLCVLYNGAYVKSDYTCPSTMVFDPTSQACSGTAVCIDNICSTQPLIPLFPKLPDPNGPDCRTYIQCMGLVDKYPVIGTCPSGLLFDQDFSPQADCWIQGNCT
nr:PREDICTED: uncharacterized protein LOC103312677 [Tribolium castaneum]|eukprot:XP_008192391.2 PREDICTED: uncharacterized protein LOC103312677 [Tribolium castaneum]